ncbi:hypothetical protein [Massilia aquatica]|uniref:DUF4149 domain-containing protein n=1 Tax=Massilia aquatica TaxID=2609000 RepID=A0ABX0MIB4_9BURK|nr:hypothetical protein [Massilia aquatica]NHZ44677.1 hypothetical protein [Massilia aquatica]
MESGADLTAPRAALLAMMAALALLYVPDQFFERSTLPAPGLSAGAALAWPACLLNDALRQALALALVLGLGARIRMAAPGHGAAVLALGALLVLILLLALGVRIVAPACLADAGLAAWIDPARRAAMAHAFALLHQQGALLTALSCASWVFIALSPARVPAP